ncbi:MULTISPECIES: AAA family ATPase [unclassified Streptococcus]|uniref:AAA family ATPase n=1 Tax=unclassified Streptococcus TaxID=2608887 RepID=UPI001D1641FB|nr:MULTISPECIES: AAA family ATPase [unclassified Streptococcus]
MRETTKILDDLSRMFQNKSLFYPFIEHIRFPKYKSLEENSKITFSYPVTLLVGQNGGNKTSILQALYGSPDGYSVSDYWFSTDVDTIDEDEEKNEKSCLIYGYFNTSANKIVEVLKGRSGTAKGMDYWEPYAPQKNIIWKSYQEAPIKNMEVHL